MRYYFYIIQFFYIKAIGIHIWVAYCQQLSEIQALMNTNSTAKLFMLLFIERKNIEILQIKNVSYIFYIYIYAERLTLPSSRDLII